MLKPLLSLTLLAAVSLNAAEPSITMLGRPYHLGSYNQTDHPMWEFVAPGEKIDSWKTLVTVIDRPDATTLKQLDGLSEGINAVYKKNGGTIITARTSRDSAGKPFNYTVVALKESATTTEVNFVKVSLGPKNAQILIYGTRFTDPKDPNIPSKAYYEQHAAEIAKALENAPAQPVETLPRRVF